MTADIKLRGHVHPDYPTQECTEKICPWLARFGDKGFYCAKDGPNKQNRRTVCYDYSPFVVDQLRKEPLK